MTDRVLAMIGMATKAGKTVSGEYMTEKAVKSQKAFLVIVSEEASENTKKMFRNMCAFYKVPFYTYGSMENLGHSMGKQFRASMAVTDEGFAKSIEKRLSDTIVATTDSES